jgi:hypothetical protein
MIIISFLKAGAFAQHKQGGDGQDRHENGPNRALGFQKYLQLITTLRA